MRASVASQTYPLQSLGDISDSIRQRRVSPVEVVTTCLDRIERLQPRLNAFITVVADTALQAAKKAAKEIEQGRWKGPLHGIPIGIKDFYDTAGLATTAAFERFRNRIPKKDAVSVEKLKRAGAIVIGKTNMHTLGMGTTGLDSCFGPVMNPWNANYIPGGSSSGSAAAVASGLCYATLDTDAIGSCRLPAACCGVVGYKGSYGAIDLRGILEGEQPPDDTIRWMSHAGLTTRSIQDTALVLDVLAEHNHHANVPTWRRALAAKSELRIGVADNVKVDQEVSNAFNKAVATLRSLGHTVNYASAPFTDFSKGIANVESDRKAIGHLAFKDIDVLVLPTIATATPTVKDAAKNPLALPSRLTMFANYYGLPAVSVPCGFDDHGLPVGLQIVGKPREDGAILQLAWQYERAAEFGKKQPIA
ncbi:MAG TPA: amidase [Vicinamibacterales bacterium]|jgi:aspartyl-tRNA(Asn)/glutamyl-tRNA(Gln) amidotransferase subunit A|nr:amidase [Vicinamibacterales bacterium]HEX2462646.1 amidase [Vicinamibacterales bacterium]